MRIECNGDDRSKHSNPVSVHIQPSYLRLIHIGDLGSSFSAAAERIKAIAKRY